MVTDQQGISAVLSRESRHCAALGSGCHRATYSEEIPLCCSKPCCRRQAHGHMKMLTEHPQEAPVGSNIVREDMVHVCVGGERISTTSELSLIKSNLNLTYTVYCIHLSFSLCRVGVKKTDLFEGLHTKLDVDSVCLRELHRSFFKTAVLAKKRRFLKGSKALGCCQALTWVMSLVGVSFGRSLLKFILSFKAQ